MKHFVLLLLTTLLAAAPTRRELRNYLVGDWLLEDNGEAVVRFEKGGTALFFLPDSNGDQERTEARWRVASGDTIIFFHGDDPQPWHCYFGHRDLYLVYNGQTHQRYTAVNRTVPPSFYTTEYSLRRAPKLDLLTPADVIASFYYHLQAGNFAELQALVIPEERAFFSDSLLAAIEMPPTESMVIRIVHEGGGKAAGLIEEGEELSVGGGLVFGDGRWWFTR